MRSYDVAASRRRYTLLAQKQQPTVKGHNKEDDCDDHRFSGPYQAAFAAASRCFNMLRPTA